MYEVLRVSIIILVFSFTVLLYEYKVRCLSRQCEKANKLLKGCVILLNNTESKSHKCMCGLSEDEHSSTSNHLMIDSGQHQADNLSRTIQKYFLFKE